MPYAGPSAPGVIMTPLSIVGWLSPLPTGRLACKVVSLLLARSERFELPTPRFEV
jgi:hypothetical protein